jgi:hypothetical protein
MAAAQQPEQAEAEHQHPGGEPDRPAPAERRAGGGEGQQQRCHGEEVAGRQREPGREDGRVAPALQPGGHGQRPAHRRVEPVPGAQRDDRQPERGIAHVRLSGSRSSSRGPRPAPARRA